MVLKNEIMELFNDKDFSEKLLLLENDTQVKEHFKNYGVEISDDELEDIRKLIFDMISRADKLNLSELEKVDGGVAVGTALLLSTLPSIVGLGVGCLGIPKFVEEVNKTKLQKKNLECETQKNIALINAKENSSVQKYKSIANVAMATAILGTGIFCFRKDIKKWWNNKKLK